jgi:hypothetical protein
MYNFPFFLFTNHFLVSLTLKTITKMTKKFPYKYMKSIHEKFFNKTRLKTDETRFSNSHTVSAIIKSKKSLAITCRYFLQHAKRRFLNDIYISWIYQISIILQVEVAFFLACMNHIPSHDIFSILMLDMVIHSYLNQTSLGNI